MGKGGESSAPSGGTIGGGTSREKDHHTQAPQREEGGLVVTSGEGSGNLKCRLALL